MTEEQRFLFVTGKGGTGKTTVAAALALATARRGKRVLVTTCNRKERLSALFGVPPLSTEIRRIVENVYAVRLVPQYAIREYGTMVLKRGTVYRAVFNRRTVQKFFAGVPGLNEWAMLGKAWFHSTERGPDDTPRFDQVLFDAPATGHALDMLRVPQVIAEVAPAGVLRRDAEKAVNMFRDPAQTGFVVVTSPEDMPTRETLDLIAALRRDLGLRVTTLVINGVVEPLFSERERKEFLGIPPFEPGGPGEEALACGIMRAALEDIQANALARLKSVDAPQVRLPYLRHRAATPEAVRTLSAYL